jgi:transcriptional regulator with XRE-family HTH domain
VFVFGDENFLGDGFHRVAAAYTIGRIEIAAEQKPGTRIDADDYAVTANAQRGQPLKASERNAGIRRLLSHRWTQEKIAEAVGVDHSTVVNIHNSLALQGKAPKEANVGVRNRSKPVAALPPEVSEKIGDTKLYQIARLSTDAERLAVAQVVADGELSVVETVATVQTVKRDGLDAGLERAKNIAVARKIKKGMRAAVDADAEVAINGALLGLSPLRNGFSPEEAAAGVTIESRDYYIGEFTKAVEWMTDFVAVLSDRRLKAV